MKTPKLNAALKDSNPSEVRYKVTLNADGGAYAHTEWAETPSEVRDKLTKYAALAKGRLVVKAVTNDGIYFPSKVIFDGIPS